jgi:hypothetical protein
MNLAGQGKLDFQGDRIREGFLYAGDEVSERCYQREAEVNTHDHKGVQEPRTALARLEERRLKRRPSLGRLESRNGSSLD